MSSTPPAARPEILIVDDDSTVPDLLEPYLTLEGFLTMRTENPAGALEILAREPVDLIILDLMMPQISGFDLLRSIRRTSTVPVIIVSARIDEVERIVGLELGADDYITKPFSPREAVARIKAVMRRIDTSTSSTSVQDRLEKGLAADVQVIGRLYLDRRHRVVEVDRRPIELTPTEYAILQVLATNSGQALTREQIASSIDPHGWEGDDRTIDSHVANLRRKVEVDPSNPKLIVTVYGLGYKLAPVPQSSV